MKYTLKGSGFTCYFFNYSYYSRDTASALRVYDSSLFVPLTSLLPSTPTPLDSVLGC